MTASIVDSGAAHPRVLAAFRDAGWSPGAPAPGEPPIHPESWRFVLHPRAVDVVFELGGRTVEGPRGRIRFALDSAFELQVTTAPDDLADDVRDILWGEPGYPVGEGGGKVLYLAEDGRAALIDQTLCGYVRGPDLGTVLDWLLFDAEIPGIEHRAVAQGWRVTGRPMPP